MRYYIDQLHKFLQKKKKKIDALVIPTGVNANGTNVSFIRDIKQAFPDIKIIVHNTYLGDPRSNNPESNFAWPVSEEDAVGNVILKVEFAREDAGQVMASNGKNYGLNPAVDRVTINLDGVGQINALRNVLGLAILEERGSRRG